MLDITSDILLVCATSLTILLIVVGIYIIKVLRELKTSLHTANKILDNGNEISSALKQPILTASEFYTGIRDGIKTFNTFIKAKKS